MLQSVRIKNFKNLADVTVPFGRVTMLVGTNNAGKSSVLQAIQFSVSIAQSLRLDRTDWNDDRLAGTLSAQQLVYSPLRDVHALAAGGTLRQDEEQGIRVTLTTDDLGVTEVIVRRGKNKNIAVGINGRQLGETLESIDSPFSVFAPGLAGIPAYEEFRSPGIVRRAAAKGDANSVFRNILWLLRQNADGWASFEVNLARVFPGLSIDVEFDSSIHEHIAVYATRDDVRLPIDACGTGVLQAVQTLAYIDVYKPKLLILDEPDSHLHPDNQRRLARLLDELAAQLNFQVLLSTHSRHLLDEFSRLEARIHWLSSGAIQEDTVDRLQALLALGALDCGDRLRNGATPCIVLTEDSELRFLRQVLASSGLSDEICDIWSYAGCTNERTAIILARFIQDHAPGTKIVIHRDRDYLSDAEVAAYEQRMQNAGLIPFITLGSDIESHFVLPAHLTTIAAGVDPQQIEQFVLAATEEVRQQSIQRLVNRRVDVAHRERNRTGGGSPNYGAISQQADVDYAADPTRMRLGKLVLGRVSALIQQATGNNVQLCSPSPALSVALLRDVRIAIDAAPEVVGAVAAV